MSRGDLMKKIAPFLMFRDKTEEAMNFYSSIN